MENCPALVVLAAGMGSRYGGLKQMDPMGPNGETVLDYSVFDAIRAGFSKVIFVIREDFAEAFRKDVGDKFTSQIEVAYSFQKLTDLPEGFSVPEGREKPWGTSHAILAARDEIDRPFAVINADDFYGKDAYSQAASFLTSNPIESSKANYALVGYKLSNTLSDHGSVNRGICQTADGLLKGVEEVVEIARKEADEIEGRSLDGSACLVDEDAIVSMNLWGFPVSFLAELENHFISFLKERGSEMKSECYIPTVVDDLINEGVADCHVLETSSSWFGVTYPDDKPHVVLSIQQLIDSGEYPSPLV
ncbi:NTP transferase domain-containing protein [bacterium]|nr:NTP transferase domain-containing protein [Akkermansiaceae bacterium]MDB4298298.1 NTP transferase domain-containing protein [bacterium]MDA7650986.1 NTP transferase domain-containing protein [Akkermansiaceae bacterium]MDA8876187.1 NTP transferase domain-containing protein [Akkermansiaceae bacterium]MDB4272664.1 NTP transferase domain-containing protein [Akkermansiaceae bacterium]